MSLGFKSNPDTCNIYENNQVYLFLIYYSFSTITLLFAIILVPTKILEVI